MSNFTTFERAGLVSPRDLYTFARGDQMWRLTSNGRNVTIPLTGLTYYAAQIQHDTIERKDETGPQRIKVVIGTQAPIVQELAKVSTQPFYLGIHRWHTNNTGEAPTRLAYGMLSMVSFNGVSCEVELSTSETQFDKQIPTTLIQRQCPWSTYGPECGLNWQDWAFETTVSSVELSKVVVASVDGHPDGYYGNGLLVAGPNKVYHIGSQIGTTIKVFGIPDILAGDTIKIVAGDDFTYQTCDGKFHHINDNIGLGFFGFEWLPNKDPMKHTTINAI